MLGLVRFIYDAHDFQVVHTLGSLVTDQCPHGRWVVYVNGRRRWDFPAINGWDIEATVKAWTVDWWNQFNTN